MLQLRPSCEHCDRALPPEATDAMICTFECTFCRGCVDDVLGNVCPNCGGGFCPRPIRPTRNWKNHNDCETYPPSAKVIHRPVDPAQHRAFAAAITGLAPHKR